MDVRLPQLAEGADSGTVVDIFVTEGQQIEKDQNLLELENQKAVAPIPSPASGTVTKIHVKTGDVVTIGQLLVSLTGVGKEGKEELQGSPISLIAPPSPAPHQVVPSPSGAPAPSAPSVRKLARQMGIDLAKVPGSERGGRITDQDLRRYLNQLQQSAQAGQLPDSSAAVLSEQIDFSKWGPIRREPLSAVRSAIGKAMTESWTTIPHVTQLGEAELTGILLLKKKYGSLYKGRGVDLTVTSFILDAVTQVLKKHPIFNASLDEAAGELVFKEYVHLGIAVDTPAGLIVPVLRNADQKNLLELSKELKDLAERTRQRKVSLEELQGASFSVSNQGGIGGTHFTPIIHRPEVAVLGVGRGLMRAVLSGKKVQNRSILPLSLSYDHRVIDGANAARFIQVLAEALEQFPEDRVKLGQNPPEAGPPLAEAESKKQKAEGRKQKAEGRKQKTKGRRQKAGRVKK